RAALWAQRASTSGWIELASAASVVDAYGICTARPHVVASAADAAEAAAQVGYPVVLDRRAAHDDEPLDELRSLADLATEWDGLLARHGPGALPMAVMPAGPRAELQVHVTPHP